jgi:hypothetical protein
MNRVAKVSVHHRYKICYGRRKLWPTKSAILTTFKVNLRIEFVKLLLVFPVELSHLMPFDKSNFVALEYA